VIVVASSEALARNRCMAAREVLPRESQRHYFFTWLEYFSLDAPQRVLEDIFITPSDFDKGRRYFLIPSLPNN